MTPRLAGVAASALLLTVSACSTDPTSPSASPSFNPLADPQQVPVLMRQELGEDITVRTVSLTEYGFRAEVRDPTQRENLDDYRFYNGQWDTEPVSVSQYDIDRLDRTTFRLGAVDWSVIPDLERQALAGLDLEDEEVSVVSVDRIDGEQPRIFISVQGSRGTGRLIADARGRNVEIRRN